MLKMKNYSSIILTAGFIFIFLFPACREEADFKGVPYQKNKTLSREDGIPLKENVNYVPDTMKFVNTKVKNSLDTNFAREYSSTLYYLHEPILYNKYLGCDTYRLFCNNEHPIVFSLNKTRDSVYLLTKITYQPYNRKNQKDGIIYNKSVRLSSVEWNVFEQRINDIGYFNEYPWKTGYVDYMISDYIILESHNKNKYWVVVTAFTDDNYKWFYNYLLKLSGAGSMVDSLKIE